MTAHTPNQSPKGAFDREELNRSLNAAVEESERYGYVSAEESERRIQELFASWEHKPTVPGQRR